MSITCAVCKGKGVLWNTPKLISSDLNEFGHGSVLRDFVNPGQASLDRSVNQEPPQGGVPSGTSPNTNPDKPQINQTSDSGIGLGVNCWRCVGKGYIPSNEGTGDPGEEL